MIVDDISYVVIGDCGEYSDYSWWSVRAFDSKADAESFLDRLDTWMLEYWPQELGHQKLAELRRSGVKCPFDDQMVSSYERPKYYVLPVPKNDDTASALAGDQVRRP